MSFIKFDIRFIAYQHLWVIWYQSNPSRWKVVILFNPYLVGDKRVPAFPSSMKMNLTALLEFELVYYDIEVQHISQYATRSHP